MIICLWTKVIGTPLLELFRYWIGMQLSYADAIKSAGLGLKKMTSKGRLALGEIVK